MRWWWKLFTLGKLNFHSNVKNPFISWQKAHTLSDDGTEMSWWWWNKAGRKERGVETQVDLSREILWKILWKLIFRIIFIPFCKYLIRWIILFHLVRLVMIFLFPGSFQLHQFSLCALNGEGNENIWVFNRLFFNEGK